MEVLRAGSTNASPLSSPHMEVLWAGIMASGDFLVGHRILVGALAEEETPVGGPVFALHGAADGGAAEGVMGWRPTVRPSVPPAPW
ncbi:hypothetical protein NHX12_025296 [Muraenolepis orangiensis]|uniref:Uncharacterized protein n=1 Tax=Muraenolepis orangiensis TaxID=630683 RepID=A0A9Q0IPI4_9TELE|nr:hypothetical protein NHX12_025296 [Muraenolepis orangiensis]